MANIWEHPSIIASEALRHLEDALVIGPLCTKDKTSEFTKKSNGWKVGDEVAFKTHGDYEVKEFTTNIDIQEIRTSSRVLKIEKHLDVSVEVTSREAALDLDSFTEQVIIPASYRLAERVDTYLGTKLLEAQGLYVSNALFESAADIAQARKTAIIQQLSMNRYGLVDLDIEAVLLGQTWFNQAQTRGGEGLSTLSTGNMGRVMGMDWFSSIAFPTNVSTHTAGTGTGATDNTGGANKIGATTLTCTALTAAINAGDRIQIAGVRRPLAVQTTAASGATSIALSHPITEIIPDASAITVVGSGQDLTWRGAIMDDRALAVAFPMLDLPGDKTCATASNNGVSIRIVKGYDMNTKVDTMSLDLLIGAFMLDPRRVTLVAESA
jgi:hypothetical protein